MRLETDGSELHGARVAGWATQQELAEMIELDVRQIRNLEDRGLPSRGRRKEKEYPLPHAWMWFLAYRAQTNRGGVVIRLCPEYAIAYAREVAAEAEARDTGKLITRRRQTR